MAEIDDSINRFELVLARFEKAVQATEAALNKTVERPMLPKHLIVDGAHSYEAHDNETELPSATG